MKKSKRLSSWRGGRGRSRVEYYIYPVGISLVKWYDGVYEWIQADQLDKTCNRVAVWGVRGINKFPTRCSADRAVNKFPSQVHLDRIISKKNGGVRLVKSWVYPEAKKPLPKLPSSARHFSAGTLVTFNCQVSLYNFDHNLLPVGNSRWTNKGTVGIVLSSSEGGLITKVFSDNFTGWVESHYLFETKL